MSIDEEGLTAAVAKELVSRAYDDVVHLPASDVGGALHHVGTALSETVRTALRPYKGLLWTVNEAFDWVAGRVVEIMENRKVPVQRVVAPPAEIEANVILALQWVGPAGASGLREMFAALLATAMDEDTAFVAHPAFGDMLRQMSPDEAKIVQLLADRFAAGTSLSVYILHASTYRGGDGGYLFPVVALEKAVQLQQPRAINVYIDNLQRLGLIELSLQDNEEVIAIHQTDDVNVALIEAEDHHAESGFRRRRIRYSATCLQFTSLGIQFVRACVTVSAGIERPTEFRWQTPLRARR